MNHDHLTVLETLSLIYEDLDLDKIEEKFINLVSETFAFDRVAFFYVKHRKNTLHGKQGKGFPAGLIEALEIPLATGGILASPLVSGFPAWASDMAAGDPLAEHLGLSRFVLVPVVNKKPVACWQEKKCEKSGCPAYGKKWLRCWLVAGTWCCDGPNLSPEEKARHCEHCSIYIDRNLDSMEGLLLADNSPSGREIGDDTVTVLSIIAGAVGRAVNNSKLFRKAVHEAVNDVLTGLYTRRYFNERLADEVQRAARYGEPLALVIGDLDHFKAINDRYGHPFGDTVLQAIGRTLKQTVRSSDIASRIGGEEFALILTNTEKNQAVEVAEKIRRAMAATPVGEVPDQVAVTMSFGVAALGDDGSSLEELLRAADRALYAAKEAGRDRVAAA